MANIALEFAPNPDLFSFDLDPVPSALLDKTSLPRARVSYSVRQGSITAKIATNTTSVRVTCTLPVNYAYVFEYCTVMASFPGDIADAGHFNNEGQLTFNVEGSVQVSPLATLHSLGAAPDTNNTASMKIWAPVNAFRTVIANSVDITAEIWDDDAVNATVLGKLNFLLTVLQYDIEQIHNVSVNAPIPVALRG